MPNSLDSILKNELVEFEAHLKKWPWATVNSVKTSHSLSSSIEYSLFSGGKRFRPTLTFAMAKALNVPSSQVMGWAMAVEAIHTYSLIHDDLPCLDNDDFRRGVPTNHKKFSESTALLAGDSLLTSAFEILAVYYQDSPRAGLNLVKLLSQNAGSSGMVGGQFLDLNIPENTISEDDINLIHKYKTGALIAASGIGPGFLTTADKLDLVEKLSWDLGFSFQLADDILDFSPEKPEAANLARILGLNYARELLSQTSSRLIGLADDLTKDLASKNSALHELIVMNNNRLK